jgi:alkyldihydroxyacetonephosphate synthase
MSNDRAKLKWNGWGWADHTIKIEDPVWNWLAGKVGMPALLATPARSREDIKVPPPELTSDDLREFADLVGTQSVRISAEERLFHALGRSGTDLIRLHSGQVSRFPDAIIYPRSAAETAEVLKLCERRCIATVPFGGGTGQTGGISPMRGRFNALAVIDTSLMDKVFGIDKIARTITVEAGITGIALERAANRAALTTGWAPEDYEFSSVGGLIAQGQLADLLVAAKMETPRGEVHTSCLIRGSEGILGIVTEATLRLYPHEATEACRAFSFPDFSSGISVLRLAKQDGIGIRGLHLADGEETWLLDTFSSLCKPPDLLHRLQNKLRGSEERNACILIAAGSRKSDAWRAFHSVVRTFGGRVLPSETAEQWREIRSALSYLREPLLDRGLAVDCILGEAGWMRMDALHRKVRESIDKAIRETVPRQGSHGLVCCHIDSYARETAIFCFFYIYPRTLDDEVAQSKTVRNAAAEAIVAAGGALGPNGAGTDFVSHIACEMGEATEAAMRAVKQTLDPTGILNPGKRLSGA